MSSENQDKCNINCGVVAVETVLGYQKGSSKVPGSTANLNQFRCGSLSRPLLFLLLQRPSTTFPSSAASHKHKTVCVFFSCFTASLSCLSWVSTIVQPAEPICQVNTKDEIQKTPSESCHTDYAAPRWLNGVAAEPQQDVIGNFFFFSLRLGCRPIGPRSVSASVRTVSTTSLLLSVLESNITAHLERVLGFSCSYWLCCQWPR